MKTLVLSDLHTEFSVFERSYQDVDLVILAGDIAKHDDGFYWARKTWPKSEIIYVAGNHEFYDGERNALLKLFKKTANKTNIHFLENDEVVIGNVRFLGCTLWTDFKLFGLEHQQKSIRYAQYALNDFILIKNGDSIFTPNNAVYLNHESTCWLESKLINNSFDGETVVVTHHLPTWNSVSERFQDDILSACFASKLEHLLGYSKFWIHGHTHDSFDYFVNRTRVICNPRGYELRGKKENLKFNPNLIIDI